MVLPVLGVIVVARFNGLDCLANQVGKKFSVVFTILIYLSIGPGLGIPRAASVPFEMAVAPYLPAGSDIKLFMVLYSFVFFLLAFWLCMNPGKLVKRIGSFLTPSLLCLLSLNFGLVIAITLDSFGLKEKKDVMKHTVYAGVFAGSILALVYIMLTYMGMCSSGVYAVQENGAWTLRHIVSQLFGEFGAIILAAIFSLACLTTCVGLINSISQFFSKQFKFFGYRQWVIAITVFSFLVCNLGLNAILSLSIPVLDAIYPVSIVLILMGLSHQVWASNRYVYPMVVTGVSCISVIYALDNAGVPLGFLSDLCHSLPLYDAGFCWVSAALVMLILSFAVNAVMNSRSAACSES